MKEIPEEIIWSFRVENPALSPISEWLAVVTSNFFKSLNNKYLMPVSRILTKIKEGLHHLWCGVKVWSETAFTIFEIGQKCWSKVRFQAVMHVNSKSFLTMLILLAASLLLHRLEDWYLLWSSFTKPVKQHPTMKASSRMILIKGMVDMMRYCSSAINEWEI